MNEKLDVLTQLAAAILVAITNDPSLTRAVLVLNRVGDGKWSINKDQKNPRLAHDFQPLSPKAEE